MENGIGFQSHASLSIDRATGDFTANALVGFRKVTGVPDNGFKLYPEFALDPACGILTGTDHFAPLTYSLKDDDDGEGQYIALSWAPTTERPKLITVLVTYATKGGPVEGSLGPIID